MVWTLRFFDDYGSGWLWAGDAATRDRFGYGPLDEVLAPFLTPETRAEALALSARNHAMLNWDEPQTPLPVTPAEAAEFNARTALLLQRMGQELGSGFRLRDERMILHPWPP